MSFNSFQDMVNEVSRVFNKEISASHKKEKKKENKTKTW
jgi:hypothetical protein